MKNKKYEEHAWGFENNPEKNQNPESPKCEQKERKDNWSKIYMKNNVIATNKRNNPYEMKEEKMG